MDNQKGQPFNDSKGFFTPGVGNLERPKSEENLDLANNQASWSPDRDQRAIGSGVMSASLETPITTTDEIPAPNSPDVISMTLPDTQPTDGEGATEDSSLISSQSDGDKPARFNVVSVVDDKILELSQTGSANNFYDAIRGENGMSKTYLSRGKAA